MKEIIALVLIALSSVFILGYSIHMLIGGLVSKSTETWTIAGACSVGVIILIFMGLDIVKQRRSR
ncbi:MAG: hypothetical protein ACK2TU_00090 [Anaerolineales bacterium]|jgi:Mn2+/Fe2+ NRAMP family transporter